MPPTIATPTVDEAEQRRRAEEEAARTRSVFFQTEQASPTAAETAGEDSPRRPLPAVGLTGQPGQPTAQDRQLAFLNAAVDRRTVSSDRVMPPASPYVLQAGAVIPAALITGIRSDLPGQITAQVTENIYDSPTGRILLDPAGHAHHRPVRQRRQFGQRRVLLVWNRLIFPDGRSIVLERQPGADAAGLCRPRGRRRLSLVGAVQGRRALHPAQRWGGDRRVGQESEVVRALRSSARHHQRAGQQIVQRQLNIAPTLTIRPGFPVRVIVTRDLVLEPYGG